MVKIIYKLFQASAAALALALASCSAKEEEQTFMLDINPIHPAINETVSFSGQGYEWVDVDTEFEDSNGDFDPANDHDKILGGTHNYTKGGIYTVKAVHHDGRQLEKKLIVRPHPEFNPVTDKSDLEMIIEQDWQDYVFGTSLNPILPQSCFDEIKYMDLRLNPTVECIVSRQLTPDSLVYQVGVLNADEIRGFSDSNGDIIPEYFGTRKLSTFTQNRLDQLFHQPLDKSNGTLLIQQTVPENSSVGGGFLDLLGEGTIYCDAIIQYTIDSVLISVGAIYGQPATHDQQTLDNFNANYHGAGNYVPVSVVVIPQESSEFKIRKAMGDEYKYHQRCN